MEAVLPPVRLPSSDESLVYRVTAAALNEMTGALAGCPHRGRMLALLATGSRSGLFDG